MKKLAILSVHINFTTSAYEGGYKRRMSVPSAVVNLIKFAFNFFPKIH